MQVAMSEGRFVLLVGSIESLKDVYAESLKDVYFEKGMEEPRICQVSLSDDQEEICELILKIDEVTHGTRVEEVIADFMEAGFREGQKRAREDFDALFQKITAFLLAPSNVAIHEEVRREMISVMRKYT